jgi:hypothetical protein
VHPERAVIATPRPVGVRDRPLLEHGVGLTVEAQQSATVLHVIRFDRHRRHPHLAQAVGDRLARHEIRSPVDELDVVGQLRPDGEAERAVNPS